MCSSVPTKDQVLVPETLLKKRKSQEKARAERSAEVEKKKKVSRDKPLPAYIQLKMMDNCIHASTRLRSMMFANYTVFRV